MIQIDLYFINCYLYRTPLPRTFNLFSQKKGLFKAINYATIINEESRFETSRHFLQRFDLRKCNMKFPIFISTSKSKNILKYIYSRNVLKLHPNNVAFCVAHLHFRKLGIGQRFCELEDGKDRGGDILFLFTQKTTRIYQTIRIESIVCK